jgi:hypothetical protein
VRIEADFLSTVIIDENELLKYIFMLWFQLKYIYDVLVIGETDSPSTTIGLQIIFHWQHNYVKQVCGESLNSV